MVLFYQVTSPNHAQDWSHHPKIWFSHLWCKNRKANWYHRVRGPQTKNRKWKKITEDLIKKHAKYERRKIHRNNRMKQQKLYLEKAVDLLRTQLSHARWKFACPPCQRNNATRTAYETKNYRNWFRSPKILLNSTQRTKQRQITTATTQSTRKRQLTSPITESDESFITQISPPTLSSKQAHFWRKRRQIIKQIWWTNKGILSLIRESARQKSAGPETHLQNASKSINQIFILSQIWSLQNNFQTDIIVIDPEKISESDRGWKLWTLLKKLVF